jgi:hypothetical protein
VFVVSREGYGNEVTTRTFEAGAEPELTIGLTPPVPPSAPAPVTPPSTTDAKAGTSPSRLPLYIALGVGGAGLATGAISGSIALAQKSKLASTCQTLSCSGAGATDLSRADTAADVSTAGFIVGGIGAATAAVFWWFTPRSTPRVARVWPWLGPAGGGVSGSF